MTEQRVDSIRQVLQERFGPLELLVKDQSQLHAGHAGAREGGGHFDVRIVADAFAGLSRIERHRLVYQALQQLLENDIHALRIKALTPDER